MTPQEFRSHFQETAENGIFFDNASMGPVAPVVTQAMTQCMQLRQAMPMKYYQYAEQVFPACRALLAELIGADPQDIAFTENVAYGINAVAGSLPLQDGDNVILCDREFGSNVYPWLRLQQSKGIEARIVPNDGGGLTPALLDRYADARTRVVTMSSVQFSDGFAADLNAIGQWCKSHRAYFVVDCAQSLGVMPMDVQEFQIDFLAGLSSKWLLGPFSTGFLYVNPALADQLLPPFAGADSVTTSVDSVAYELAFRKGAGRFELSLPNAPGVAGLEASLRLMKQVGFDRIGEEARKVSSYFIDGLQKIDHVELAPCALTSKHRSAIVSFKTPNVDETYRFLRANRIACSVRCGYIRTGLHAYNTTGEVEQVLALLHQHL